MPNMFKQTQTGSHQQHTENNQRSKTHPPKNAQTTEHKNTGTHKTNSNTQIPQNKTTQQNT